MGGIAELAKVPATPGCKIHLATYLLATGGACSVMANWDSISANKKCATLFIIVMM